jgi:hypothetical protein
VGDGKISRRPPVLFAGGSTMREEDERKGFVEVFPENFPSWARRRPEPEEPPEQEEDEEEDGIRAGR